MCTSFFRISHLFWLSGVERFKKMFYQNISMKMRLLTLLAATKEFLFEFAEHFLMHVSAIFKLIFLFFPGT